MSNKNTTSSTSGPFTTSTVATTVIQSKDGTKIVSDTAVTPPRGAPKPTITQSTKEMPSTSTSSSSSSSKLLAPQKPVLDHPPRRAPIEEAMIPQPRPAPTVDTEHEPRLLDTMAEKLSRVVTSVKEGAEGVTEKVKSVTSTVAQKTDEAAASAARATGNLVSSTGDKMEAMSQLSEQRAKFRSERAKEHDEMASEHYARAKQPFSYSNGSRPKEWTSEDEAILLQIRREIQEKRSMDQKPNKPYDLRTGAELAATPSSRYDSTSWNATTTNTDSSKMAPSAGGVAGHDNDHHGAVQSIRDWFHDHWYSNNTDDVHADAKPFPIDGRRMKPPSWKDFEEGSDMAKDEATKRLQRVARETEAKIDAARRAAEQWEREAQEQVADAYANARSHSQQLLKEAQSYHAPGSLAKSLHQIKAENARLKSHYVHELCDHHPDRSHCYDAMKHITGLAKENARIKVVLSDKHLKNH